MLFRKLADAYDRFENLSGNALRTAVASFYSGIRTSDVKKVTYLTLGAISPDYQELDLGMAGKMALRAVEKAYGELPPGHKKTGDLGLVAESLARNRKASLSVDDVFSTLTKIASTKGSRSQDEKIRLFASLLSKATPLEARYIARLATGKLRLGLAAKTVLAGVAKAHNADKQAVENAFNSFPDAGTIAEMVASGKSLKGTAGVGIPIQMMLCQRVKDIGEALRKLGTPLAAEQKYDGERVQIHKNGKKITLFSRRLEDITAQFPEIVSAASKIKAKSAIIEGEIMAIKGKELLGFQALMSRRRKHDIAEYAKSLPAVCFCFELLYIDGKSMADSSYPKRYSALSRLIKGDTLRMAQRVVCSNTKCVESLFKKVVGKGGEGVVMKSLRSDSTYQAGVRGWHWVKWKPEYSKGMQDTFDLVVVGAFWGKGRRSGKYGALLCAAYDKKTRKYESFCKLGSGFKDTDLSEMTKSLKAIESKPADVVVGKMMTPDIWLSPDRVLEVLAAEISVSPFHTACRGRKEVPVGKGLALRFPRFVRWREDKKPEQATTTDEIMRMRIL